MEKLVFATGNINKGYEIEKRFKKKEIPVEVIHIDFNEPVVNDIEIVSKSKALEAYNILKRPCFVIDSGFVIHNYPGHPGYPGAFVRRSGISTNIDGLLDTLKDVTDRRCEFLDCLTFYDGEEFYSFYGIDKGVITKEKRGEKNKLMRSDLWYVFKPIGYDKTLAEMTDEEREERKGKHISAKDQFIEWYKEHFWGRRLEREKNKNIF